MILFSSIFSVLFENADFAINNKERNKANDFIIFIFFIIKIEKLLAFLESDSIEVEDQQNESNEILDSGSSTPVSAHTPPNPDRLAVLRLKGRLSNFKY